eukprot:gb/GEZN01002920.1/.p1 GENE.gb/GEZN01002920.1/~~gb/GEZN01002920.1/.p1  ORF type:complete len:565 (-),score=42.36 gb/GEZN01002920.1/:535-2229(-)
MYQRIPIRGLRTQFYSKPALQGVNYATASAPPVSSVLQQNSTFSSVMLPNSNISQLLSEPQFTHALQSQQIQQIHQDSLAISDERLQSLIDSYATKAPSALSIRHFIEFSKMDENLQPAVHSAEFLFNHELPIRVSHMVKIMDRLPPLFREMPHVQKARGWYQQTFRDILVMQKKLAASNTMCDVGKRDLVQLSISTSKGILQRHAPIVSTMASGLQFLHRALRVKEIPSYERFLDDLFMSRIGTRLCMTQHIELFEPLLYPKKKNQSNEGGAANAPFLGVFDEHLDLHRLLTEASSSARFLCCQKYGSAPEVEVKMYETRQRIECKQTGKSKLQRREVNKLHFSYVPSHLYHILFELLKNSMRAVVEMHSDEHNDSEEDEFPPIRVILVKAEHDLTIKIIDQGGGVPRHQLDKIFKYSYTTADTPITDDEIVFNMNNAPLAGYGYGLPMSRLYCRYFHGDLRLESMEGYGMDSLVYLKRIASDAKETVTTVGGEKPGTHFLTREELIGEWSTSQTENQALKKALEDVADIVSHQLSSNAKKKKSKPDILERVSADREEISLID